MKKIKVVRRALDFHAWHRVSWFQDENRDRDGQRDGYVDQKTITPRCVLRDHPTQHRARGQKQKWEGRIN